MRQLYEAASFVRAARRRLRFGEVSRAPIEILRLALRGDRAECDWMARLPDSWDADLSGPERDQSASRQALADAMAMREILLDELPTVTSSVLRGFRASERGEPELIVVGTVTREETCLLRVPSPVMRAKLCGFQFDLEDGFLRPLNLSRRNCDGRK
jgi:hypothetical protein